MSIAAGGLVSCPACAHAGPHARDIRVGDYWVVVCRACGTGWTDPTPTEIEVEEVNTTVYELEAHVAERLARRSELAARSAPLLAWARQHGDVNSVVDVGSHLGYLLADFRSLGVTAVAGVELNSALRLWASREHRLQVVARCEDLPAAAWDLVTMLDVLEHTPNPGGLLSDAARLVRPGGLILVQSPNHTSEMARRSAERWSWWAMPDHAVHFSPEGVSRLAARVGLESVALETGDFLADYMMDVLPRVPNAVPLAIRRTGVGRRFHRRRAGRGGLIRALLRRPQRPSSEGGDPVPTAPGAP